MAASTNSMRKSASQTLARHALDHPLIAFLACLLAWLLLNLVIGGQCDWTCVVSTLAQTLRIATPIAFAAFCGVMCERAGVVDIGIEGKMLMAAMVGLCRQSVCLPGLKDYHAGARAANLSRWLALMAGAAGGAAAGSAARRGVDQFKADQIISGTVINILAIGLTGYIYRQFLAENLPAGPGHFPDHAISRCCAAFPSIGPIFFSRSR